MSFEKVKEKDTESEFSRFNSDYCNSLNFHYDFLHFGSLFSSQLVSDNEKSYHYFKGFFEGENSLKLLEFFETSWFDNKILQIYSEILIMVISKKWSLFTYDFISSLSKIIQKRIIDNAKEIVILKRLKECWAKLIGEIYFQEMNENLCEFVIGVLDLSNEHADIGIDIIKYMLKCQNISEKFYIKDFHRKTSQIVPMISKDSNCIENLLSNKYQNSKLANASIEIFKSEAIPSLFIKLLMTLETLIDDATVNSNKIEIIQKIIFAIIDILNFEGQIVTKKKEIDEIYSKNIFLLFFKLFENFLTVDNQIAAANCLQFIYLNQEKIFKDLSKIYAKYHMQEIIKGATIILKTKFGLNHEIVFESFAMLISKLDHKEIAHNIDFYMEISSFTINSLQSKASKNSWHYLMNFWKNLSEYDYFMNGVLKQTSWDIWKIYIKMMLKFEDEKIWSYDAAKLVVIFKGSNEYYQEVISWILKQYNLLLSADIEYEDCSKLIKLIYIWCSVLNNDRKDTKNSKVSIEVNFEKFVIHQEMLENILNLILIIEGLNNIFSHPLLQPCLYFIKCFTKLYCSSLWSQNFNSSFIETILIKIYQEFLCFKVDTHSICLKIFTQLINSIHCAFKSKKKELKFGTPILAEIHVFEIMRLYSQYILKNSSKIAKIRNDFSHAITNLYNVSKKRIDLFYLLTPISILFEISIEDLSYIYNDLKGIIRALNNPGDFEIFFDWYFLNESKMVQKASSASYSLFFMRFIKEFIEKFIIFADNYDINKSQTICKYAIMNLNCVFIVLANCNFAYTTNEEINTLEISIDVFRYILKYKINHSQQALDFTETINLANAAISHFPIEILCSSSRAFQKCQEF